MRLSKPALFELLGYTPHAGQLAVHRSMAPRRVLACGVRWGKSTVAVMEATAALLNPSEHTLGWSVAPTYELARLVFDRVVWNLETYFRHRIKELDLREHRLVVINFGGGRSELRGKSTDNPTSLLGQGIDFVIVDEAARMKAEIWFEHLSQRLLDRRGWALLISTPHGRDWFWRLYRRGQKSRDRAFESWSSPTWANPHLDRALVEAERARVTDDVHRETYGAEFLGLDPEPCDRCHGPDPKVAGCVILEGDEELPVCRRVRGHVDKETGHTLMTCWSDGSPYISIIRLYPRREPVPLPFTKDVVRVG